MVIPFVEKLVRCHLGLLPITMVVAQPEVSALPLGLPLQEYLLQQLLL